MKEIKRDETQIYHSLRTVLGITILAFLMLVNIAGAASFAYITNWDSNTVSVIDTATDKVTSTVDVEGWPQGVAVSPDGSKVYVANFGSNSVSVIDATSNSVSATIPVGQSPQAIAISPDGSKVYVANYNSCTVSVIDAATNIVTDTLPGGLCPMGIAVTPDGSKIYLANSIDITVSVIDTATKTVTNVNTMEICAGSGVSGVAITPDGSKVYVVNGDNTVSIIDTATNDVTDTGIIVSIPGAIAFSPDGAKAYVTSGGSNSVSVIDTLTNTVIDAIPVGSWPLGVSITPDGKKVYVANYASNTVSVIDTLSNTVIATVPVGSAPGALGQFIGPALAKATPTITWNNPADIIAGTALSDTQLNAIANDPVSGDPVEGTFTYDPAVGTVLSAGMGQTLHVDFIPTDTATYNTASKDVTINVLEQLVTPVAAFSASPTTGKIPLTVAFTDSSTGSPTSWSWKFGDGNTSTEQNPVNIFNKTGIYTVKLTVKNSAGSSTVSKSKYITVTTGVVAPIASFTASPLNGNTPLRVTFTDTSEGFPTSWKWSFGDGNTSTEQNPENTYNKAGIYTVKLTVKNSAGSSTATKSSYITVLAPPVAAFSASPVKGKVPLMVTFTDKSKGSPSSWMWNFGDGNTSTEQNPVNTYSEAGTYTVTLIANNDAGSNTVTKSGYIKVK